MSAHGYGRYTDGCRCEVCRKAKADYMRTRRAEARQNASAPVELLRHGTRFAYEERGCRCPACAEARAASDRKYWPRRAAQLDARRIREATS